MYSSLRLVFFMEEVITSGTRIRPSVGSLVEGVESSIDVRKANTST
jgi:hypothetical protein